MTRTRMIPVSTYLSVADRGRALRENLSAAVINLDSRARMYNIILCEENVVALFVAVASPTAFFMGMGMIRAVLHYHCPRAGVGGNAKKARPRGPARARMSTHNGLYPGRGIPVCRLPARPGAQTGRNVSVATRPLFFAVAARRTRQPPAPPAAHDAFRGSFRHRDARASFLIGPGYWRAQIPNLEKITSIFHEVSLREPTNVFGSWSVVERCVNKYNSKLTRYNPGILIGILVVINRIRKQFRTGQSESTIRL